MAKNGKAEEKKRVNVALQGGGSHGAFTWGVLDRLLEDGRLELAAVSGTSAGAMNAVALADGWVRGGAEGARERLAEFWRAVARKGRFSPVQRTPWDMLLGNWSIENSPAMSGSTPCRGCSRPMWPTRSTSIRCARWSSTRSDFDNVRSREAIKLFISATNVETGQLRVFDDRRDQRRRGDGVGLPAADLPGGDIDGVPYWDGGYGGNPAIFPFFYANEVEDVLLVQINPVMREGHAAFGQRDPEPHRRDHLQRHAAAANSGRSLRQGADRRARAQPQGEFRDIRMHRIDADEAFKDLSASSKVNAEWAFLEYLRDLGRNAAEDWLEDHFDAVGHAGRRSTCPRNCRPGLRTALRPRMGTRVRQFLATRLNASERYRVSAEAPAQSPRPAGARLRAVRPRRDPRLHAFEPVEQQIGKRVGA